MSEPGEVEAIRKILEAMSPDYDHEVPFMLHEFYQRHLEEVLNLARSLSPRQDQSLKLNEVKLATELLAKRRFTRPVREELREQAKACNKVPLAEVTDKFGLMLPAEAQSLTAKNFQIVSQKDLPMNDEM